MVLGTVPLDELQAPLCRLAAPRCRSSRAVVNALLVCISAPRLAVVSSDPVQAKALGITSPLPYCDSNERRVIAVADREGVDCSLET